MSEAITTPHLTRKRTVLEIVDGKNASFAQVDDDGQPSDDSVHVRLPQHLWQEMGEPLQLTVAIRPGDRQDIMESDLEQAQAQIDRLATFIMDVIDGEPSQSEGAVDTAIRLLDKHYGPPAGANA